MQIWRKLEVDEVQPVDERWVETSFQSTDGGQHGNVFD